MYIYITYPVSRGTCPHRLRLCLLRLTVLRSDPSIPPPTPRCPGARGANMLEEAAAEAPTHSSSSSPSPTLPRVSTELSRLTNSLLTSPHHLSQLYSFIHPSLGVSCFSLSLRLSAMSSLSPSSIPKGPGRGRGRVPLKPPDRVSLDLHVQFTVIVRWFLVKQCHLTTCRDVKNCIPATRVCLSSLSTEMLLLLLMILHNLSVCSNDEALGRDYTHS